MRIMIAIFLLLALAGCGGHPPVVVIPPAPPPVVAPEPPLPPDPLPDPPIPDWILEIYPDARQVWIGSAAFYISGGFTAEHVRKYVGTAFADTLKLRPAAKLEGMLVVKEMPNDCPRSTGPAFFADEVMWSFDIAGMRKHYPLSFVDDRPCVHGYFDAWSIPPVIYGADGLSEVIDHEALHAIWWSNWVGERCGGDAVWTVVEHGGPCDPFDVAGSY